jgi:hypothetical protein
VASADYLSEGVCLSVLYDPSAVMAIECCFEEIPQATPQARQNSDATHALHPNDIESSGGQEYMSLIRVCAITCDCYPEDVLVRRTAEAGASAGFEYHVICSMHDGQARHEIFNGVYVHRIRIRGRDGKPLGRITAMPLSKMLTYWSLFNFLACKMVARLHFKWKFDVVHVHNLPDFLAFAAIVPKCFGARVVLHIQDVAPELMAAKAKGFVRKLAVPLAKLQERISTAFADPNRRSAF